MEDNAKVVTLAQHLLQKTKDKLLDWESTVGENSFRCVLKSGLVRIEKAVAKLGNTTSGDVVDEHFTILVLNLNNEEIGRYTSGKGDLAILRDLYDAAYKSARKPEETLEAILVEVTSK